MSAVAEAANAELGERPEASAGEHASGSHLVHFPQSDEWPPIGSTLAGAGHCVDPDVSRTTSSSHKTSSGSRSVDGAGVLGGTSSGDMAFKNGCWYKYIQQDSTGCQRKKCRFRHDLTPYEVYRFRQMYSESHQVFFDPSSKGDSESKSSTNASVASGNSVKAKSTAASGSADVANADSSQLPSIGSTDHNRDECKPCAFAALNACAAGFQCRYCHLPHAGVRIKMRPCKGKRDRFKRLMDRLSADIQADPLNFDISSVVLPPSVAGNDLLKKRVEEWVAERLQEECQRIESGGTAETSLHSVPKRTFGVVTSQIMSL